MYPLHFAALVLVAGAASLSCGAQTLAIGGGDEPIDLDDVEGLPAGSAQGDDASGAYQVTSFDVVACDCRQGALCDRGFTLAIAGLGLDQRDGALTATTLQTSPADPSFVLRGGIDEDGAFEIGAVSPVTVDAVETGESYNLFAGAVQPRVAIDGRWTLRARYLDDGVPVDCDLHADVALVWWDSWDGGGDTDSIPGGPGDTGGGEACDLSMPCAPDLACFEGVCQDGAEGDGCTNTTHCAPENACVDGSCWDGSEGDPCGGWVDCSPSNNCIEGTCYDGSLGDPCISQDDCDLLQALSCGPDGVCE